MSESFRNRVVFILKTATPSVTSRAAQGFHVSGGPYEGNDVITETLRPMRADSCANSARRWPVLATSGT
jgi:hypothetical protein